MSRMSAEPRLSIGIPVFNGEKLIAELLTCLQAQTFKDFEIIICDNASTDGTREICEKYVKEDSRIKFYRNKENIGAAKNFDKVFSLSRAPLFKWAACDDVLMPTYLEKCIQILDANPEVIGAHALPIYVNARCEPFVFDEDSCTYTDPLTKAKLPVKSVTGGASPHTLVRFVDVLLNPFSLKVFGVFRRDALEHSRLFRPNSYAADKALLLEMALLGRFVHVKEKLFIKRFHPDASSALGEEEIKKWTDPNSGNYSHHLRMFLAFITTPIGKPIDIITKLACICAVCAYGLIFAPIVGLRRIGLLRTPDEVKVATLGTVLSSRTPGS